MSLSRRDVLVCLSLANLSLLEVWRRIGFANRYLLPLWTWRDIVAAAVLLVLLTVLFCGMVRLGRTPRLRALAIDRWIFLVPAIVFANIFRQQFPTWRDRLLQDKYLGAYAALLALLALLAMGRYAGRIAHLAEAAALCALPFLPLSLVENTWIVATQPPRAPAVERLPARPGSPRFIWIVFDETDWHYVDPATRPADLALPEFDRMMAQSIVPQQAIQSGLQTAGAMPTLIYGQGVEVGLIGGNGKLLTVGAGRDGADWTQRPNIFSRIRARGLNTSVDGWYLPYCRIFARDLSDCYWEAIDTRVKGFDPSFSASFVSGLRSLSPLGERQRHLRRYQALERESITDAIDPTLNLVLLHLPVPHEPAIYDRKSGRFTVFNFRTDWYLDNLALADRTLGDIRRAMEKAGQWDRSTVLVTSDHGLRWYAPWHETTSPRIPYLLKLPGQRAGRPYTPVLHTILTADLIEAVLSGQIRDPDQAVSWLDARSQARADAKLRAGALSANSHSH